MRFLIAVLVLLGLAGVLTGCASPTFTLQLGSTAVTIVRGGSGSVTVTVDRSGGFEGQVTLDVLGRPEGVQATAPAIPAGATTAEVVLAAGAQVQAGTAALTVRASGGGLTREAPLALTITVPGEVGFRVETLVEDLEVPWDLAFAPDGTLFLSERGGTVRRFRNGTLAALSFDVPIPVATGGERGLMGLALDPGFPGESFLYACYSYLEGGGTRNRIVRFELTGDTLRNQQVLLGDMPGNTIHDGCRLTFGPDGNLYATLGDAGDPALAQDETSLAGKVLRIARGGAVPEDNPFGNPVWSLGHRNPQGIVFHPDSGRLYLSEHGPSCDDEINVIDRGANYGWGAVAECLPEEAPYVRELVSYTPTLAVTGTDVYRGTVFPQWQGDLLLASLKAGQLRRLALATDGTVAAQEVLIDGEYGRLRDVAVGPDGRIYLATSNRDGRGAEPFQGLLDRVLVLVPDTP